MRIFSILLLNLISINCFAVDYDPALEKAGEAMYKQVGLHLYQHNLEQYAGALVQRYGGNPVLYTLSAIRIVKERRIRFPIANNKLLELRPEAIFIIISF